MPPGQAKAKSAPLGHTARRDVPAASGGKPFASLLPPPVKYLTTAAGSHPRAESVVALAPNYAWLISAFHDECCSARTAPKRRNIVRQDGARVKGRALFGNLFALAKIVLARHRTLFGLRRATMSANSAAIPLLWKNPPISYPCFPYQNGQKSAENSPGPTLFCTSYAQGRKKFSLVPQGKRRHERCCTNFILIWQAFVNKWP